MDEKYEKLALLIDRLENLSSALSIPMSAQFHVDRLKTALPEVVSDLKESYKDITGENPWEY